MDWDVAKYILRLGKETSDVFPILKSALGGACTLLDTWEAIKDVEESYKYLQRMATEFSRAIYQAMLEEKYGLQASVLPWRGNGLVLNANLPNTTVQITIPPSPRAPRSGSEAMPEHVESALQKLGRIFEQITEHLALTSGSAAQPARYPYCDYCRRTLKRFFGLSRDQGKLRKLERELRDALMLFKLGASARTGGLLRKTLEQVEAMKKAQEESSGEILGALQRVTARVTTPIKPARRAVAKARRFGSTRETSARLDALETHVRGVDGRLRDAISEAQKYYTAEQALVLQRISEANREWERKRQDERAADRRELHLIRDSLLRIKAHVDEIEAEEAVDLVALYRLVENIANKVDNLHGSETERKRSHAETTHLLADLRKHINASAQAAASPLDRSRIVTGATTRATAARPQEPRVRTDERYTPPSISPTRGFPAPGRGTTMTILSPNRNHWEQARGSGTRRPWDAEDGHDKENSRIRRETRTAPLRRQTHPNPRPPLPAPQARGTLS